MTAAAVPTTLAWFPVEVSDWLARITFMTLEQRGALLTALLTSWQASVRGDAPGTLPDDPRALAQMLGPHEPEAMAVVLEQFPIAPNANGDSPRRRCGWFADLFAAQAAKHASAVSRGGKGGWPKGRPRRPKPADSPPIAELLPNDTNTEGDPLSGDSPSSNPPERGAGVAAVGRGGATTTPPATAPPPDPEPVEVTQEDEQAWVDAHPEASAAIEADVESHLDDPQQGNAGWRDRPMGRSVRARLVSLRVREACARERRRTTRAPAAAVGGGAPCTM